MRIHIAAATDRTNWMKNKLLISWHLEYIFFHLFLFSSLSLRSIKVNSLATANWLMRFTVFCFQIISFVTNRLEIIFHDRIRYVYLIDVILFIFRSNSQGKNWQRKKIGKFPISKFVNVKRKIEKPNIRKKSSNTHNYRCFFFLQLGLFVQCSKTKLPEIGKVKTF